MLATCGNAFHEPSSYVDESQLGNSMQTSDPTHSTGQQQTPINSNPAKPSKKRKTMSKLRKRILHQVISGDRKQKSTKAGLPTPAKKKNDEKSHIHTPQNLQPRPCASIGCVPMDESLLQRVTHLEGYVQDLEGLNENLKHELRDKSNDIRQLREDNEILKRQCSEAAIKTYHRQAQLPLTRPESELVKSWHNLAYNVNNFVDTHFGNVSQKRVASWAQSQHEYLREVSEAPQDTISSHNSGLALIKATVWIALKKVTFGGVTSKGAMCWAGQYKEDFRSLSEKLEAENIVEGFAALNFQWRTLSTNMISILQSDERDQEIQRALIDMDYILASRHLLRKRSQNYSRDLRSLISKAIDMDLWLSGQNAVYGISWPVVSHGNADFDQSNMRLTRGSPPVSGNFVKFVIQPSLVQLEKQGDSYSRFIVLDQSMVWMS